MTTGEDLAAQVRGLLDSLREPSFASFLGDWPRAARRRAIPACHLPVLRWLPDVAAGAAPFSVDVVDELCREAPKLAWRQSYGAGDFDAQFLGNYGWTEILGLHGPLASERIACGFLLLGPATHYPRHRHEAEEWYLPLSGTAAWQQGEAEWRERSPGMPIHHASEEPHAMRTGAAPLLALYLWRSNNLAQTARLG